MVAKRTLDLYRPELLLKRPGTLEEIEDAGIQGLRGRTVGSIRR